MASKFRISITREDGQIAQLYPGSQGERDLVTAIVNATMAKGVGMFRSEEHVKRDLTEAIQEVLISLKREVQPA